MTKTPHAARTIDSTVRLAAVQHGVLSLGQLLAAGLSRQTIGRRVAAGRLHRVYHGVYAVSHPGLSREGRCMAAVLAACTGAALSRLSAAALWEVRRVRTMLVDVIAPGRRRLEGPIRTHVSRTLVPADITRRLGIPVTTVARTLVDLAEGHTPHQLANVIHEAAFRNRFSEDRTRETMARAVGRRTTVLERAIALHLAGSAGTRSEAEDAFLALGHDVEPLVNMHLLGEEVDFHWPHRRLVVEIDGSGHARPPARRDDARRDAKLTAAGWNVLRFSADDVELRPREVIGRLRDA